MKRLDLDRSVTKKKVEPAYLRVIDLWENRRRICGRDVAASGQRSGQRDTKLCNSSNRISIMQYLLAAMYFAGASVHM